MHMKKAQFLRTLAVLITLQIAAGAAYAQTSNARSIMVYQDPG